MIDAVGKENLKIPQGLKPQEKKSAEPLLNDIDTDTPYFQYVDSAQTYIYSHDWAVAE